MHRDVLIGRYHALYRDRFHIGLIQHNDHLIIKLDADAITSAANKADPYIDPSWAPLKDKPINMPFGGQAPIWHQFRVLLNLLMTYHAAPTNEAYEQLVATNDIGTGSLLISIPTRPSADFTVRLNADEAADIPQDAFSWVEYARHAYGDGHNDTVNLRVLAKDLAETSKAASLSCLLDACWQDVHGPDRPKPLTESDLTVLGTEANDDKLLFVINEGRPEDLVARFSDTAYTIGEQRENGEVRLRDVDPRLADWQGFIVQSRNITAAYRAEQAGRKVSPKEIRQAVSERLVIPDLETLLPIAK